MTKTEGTAPEGSEPGSVPVDADAQGSGMNVMIGEDSMQVAQSFEAAALPEGFTAADYEYSGTTVQSGYNEAEGLRVLYLTNEAGEGDFYLYNEDDGSFAPYVVVKMAEKTIVVLPVEQMSEDIVIPEGFKKCTIDVGTHSVQGWIWKTDGDNSTPEYCVVYGMNSDGERGLYRYDQKEMTLQRYFQDPDAENIRQEYKKVAEEFNGLLDDYKLRGYIMAGLFAVSIILVIILIVLLLTRKPKGPKGRGYGETDPDIYDYVRPSKESSGTGRRQGSSRNYDGREEYEDDRYDDGDDYEDDRYEEERYGDQGGRYRDYGTKRGGRSWDDFDYEDDRIEDLDEEFDEPEVREEPPVLRERRNAAPSPKSQRSVADVEKDIAASLAKEADRAVAGKKNADEDDDFEFIDLDL